MRPHLLPPNVTRSDPVLKSMFEARKRVFVDLLKWDVPVLGKRYEIDQFDTPDATYLILAAARGKHRASARLLRTDGAHILGELFPRLCKGQIPSGATTREITRFCIDPELSRAERREARNQLVTALVEHAICTGITDYTAVASVGWFRQIAAFGWECQALGPQRNVGGELLVALHISVDEETPAKLAANGIYCPSAFRLAGAGGLQ
ncbi:MAG: autoinducer synthase [Alphaproteobacteria bacterium]|nr:autoinducer synthase [Alphaproteobacteria bacterium]